MTDNRKKWEKVKRIFQQFDANKDGCLNRQELAALLVAVEPGILYTREQLDSIVNEIFAFYSSFVQGANGISYVGVTCIYDDGVRNVDRDTSVLGLDVDGGFGVEQTSYSSNTGEEATEMRQEVTYLPIAEEELSPGAVEAIECGAKVAIVSKHNKIETEHLIKALLILKHGLGRKIFLKARVDNSLLLESTNKFIQCQQQVIFELNTVKVGASFLELMQIAREYKEEYGDSHYSVEHFVLAFTKDNRLGKKLFRDFEISQKKLKDAIQAIKASKTLCEEGRKYEALKKYGKDLTAMAQEGKLDPVLIRDNEIQRCIQILSRRTKNNPVIIGEPGVGKTAICEGLAQRIIQGDIPQALLNRKLISLDLGALIAGTQFRGEFEDRLKDVVKEVSESGRQIILFIDELHTVVGAGATSDGSMDASNLLKPVLSRGEFQCIGATTLDEYHKYIEKDAALERRFQKVHVKEPTVKETISVLRGLRDKYELHHGVCISDSALVEAAILSDRYISGRFLPDKAIDLIDEAAAKLKMEITSKPIAIDEIDCAILKLEMEKLSVTSNSDIASKNRLNILQTELSQLKQKQSELNQQREQEKVFMDRMLEIKEEIDRVNQEIQQVEQEGDLNYAAKLKCGSLKSLKCQLEAVEQELKDYLRSTSSSLKAEVTGDDISEIISKWTGIPISKLQESDKEKLLHLEEELHKRLVGQDPAVRSVAQAIQRSRVGLSDPHRPIASFMFMGPTGVGKTELAKALASYLLNTEEALVRIDMSEYMEKYAITRLIGAPPGYIGYGEGGQLTEAIRRRPYAVVLFDEIEKAHCDVFNVFLQILDDGRVTDSQGRTVSFTNTIIIMTSNVGSEHVLNADTKVMSLEETAYETTKKKVMEAARSIFRPEFMNRIDEYIVFQPLDQNQINGIVKLQLERVQQRIADQSMTIQVSDAAIRLLGSLGYDPSYGARPVKRVIQQNVENALALGMLRGDFKDGDTILIDTEITAPANGQFPKQRLVFRKWESSAHNISSESPEIRSTPPQKSVPETRTRRTEILKKLLGNAWERLDYVRDDRI